MLPQCNREISAAVPGHAPEPARKCPGGTGSGVTHPKVLPDPDIRVEDAGSTTSGEPEKGGTLDWKDGRSEEPKDRRSEEPEDGRSEEPKDGRSQESEGRRSEGSEGVESRRNNRETHLFQEEAKGT
ncbi:hypothetical protein NDU88_005259 [Pleurodeles waltl]|uniref:Uncharacterized protein n=1 Tax=Pleurodeles waltl TaxID=8319 RepID=A0AAV7SLA9_PLEWA|nr:hypothetical protein NDU88_005259 [Pleurodeles waltl]